MTSTKRWLSGIVVLLLAGLPPVVRAETSASPLADDPTLVALAVALACADAPGAVEAPPQGPGGGAASGPEIELVATVRAKTLRFDEVPKVDVVFRGSSKRRTVWRTERVNLPAHPQPGVVYHDVQVRLTITSDLDDLTAMLRDAKKASRGIRIEEVSAVTPKVPEQPQATPAKGLAAPNPLASSTATPIVSTTPTAGGTPTPTPAPTATPAPAPTATPTPPPTAAPTPTASATPTANPPATPPKAAAPAPPAAR